MVIDILIMLSFHYFADFILQPDELRKRKDKSMFIMIFHCLLYATVVMMGYLTIINIPIWYRYSRLSFIMLFMSHLFIDLGKRTVHNTILKNNINKEINYNNFVFTYNQTSFSHTNNSMIDYNIFYNLIVGGIEHADYKNGSATTGSFIIHKDRVINAWCDDLVKPLSILGMKERETLTLLPTIFVADQGGNKNNKENLLEVSKRIESIVENFTNSKLNKYYITLEMAEEDITELNNLEEFESQINKFEDAKKIILNTIEKLEEELQEIEQPDLEEGQRKLQNIESQVNDFIEKVAVFNTRLENNKKLYKKIHSEYINLLESSKDIREIIAFSDVVSGKTENRKSLETYVQGYYLDLILVAGTKRLLQMTNDRYRFIRRDEKSKGGGLQGLEIEIHDIYLNSTRIISSLSGGELFLASLALALGLAEVIQNESGGISLETIFIDEGFGSLDTETLDIALTTLIDLQSYGRNIGIISHVSELKERIRPKVEVYSKDNYAKIKMTGI